MSFFNETAYDIAAAGFVRDEVTGRYTDVAEVAKIADGFCWGNKDSYHFDKYDVPLNPQFREYVLSR